MKPKTPQWTYITPEYSASARLPFSLVSKLVSFRVASRPINRRTGELFEEGEKVTSRSVSSRVCVDALGASEVVSRVCALLLLQVGGRALVGPSRNGGGSWGHVSLSAGVQVEIA